MNDKTLLIISSSIGLLLFLIITTIYVYISSKIDKTFILKLFVLCLCISVFILGILKSFYYKNKIVVDKQSEERLITLEQIFEYYLGVHWKTILIIFISVFTIVFFQLIRILKNDVYINVNDDNFNKFNNTIMYITILFIIITCIFFIMALKKYQDEGNDLYNINRYIEIVIMIIIFIYILVPGGKAILRKVNSM